MRPRFIFLMVGLVVVLLASCAPQATQPPAAAIASPLGTDVSIPATAAPADSTSVPQATLVPTQIVDVQAVATSRGPNLQATDPTTLVLASGQLQLIEFFRFT